MRLVSDGAEVPTIAITQISSLRNYSAYLDVVSQSPLFGEFLIEGTDINLVASRWNLDVSNNLYITSLFPKSFIDLQNSIFPSFKGEFTTEDILQNCGIEIQSQFTTDKVYWEFPSFSFKDFFSNLELHTQITNGGGCFLNFTIEGRCQITDLKTLAYQDSDMLWLPVVIQSFNMDLLWSNNVRGSYTLKQYSPDKLIQREITFEDGFGKSEVVEIITNEELQDLTVRKLRNLFYRKYFHKVQVRASVKNCYHPLLLGQPIVVNGGSYLLAEAQVSYDGNASILLIQ